MRWPLREALLALYAIRAEQARTAFHFEVLGWKVVRAAGGKLAAPKPPKILEG
jgi:hypothetical protein